MKLTKKLLSVLLTLAMLAVMAVPAFAAGEGSIKIDKAVKEDEKYAEEDILKGFLPILDSFERAIEMDNNNFGDETSKFLEGFRMVYNQTRNLLEKFEVKEIECLGQEFEPAIDFNATTAELFVQEEIFGTKETRKRYTCDALGLQGLTA